MANEENKDLSIEEMRNAVLLASVMPNIEEAFNLLRSNLKKQIEAYIQLSEEFKTYSSNVADLSQKVENLLKEIPTIAKLQKQIGELEGKIKNLENEKRLMANTNSIPVQATQVAKEEPKTEVKKEKKVDSKVIKEKKDNPKEKTPEEIIAMIYAEQGGRKSRRLTIENIMGIGKCDTDLAKKVISVLKKKNKYNEKTQKMTF